MRSVANVRTNSTQGAKVSFAAGGLISVKQDAAGASSDCSQSGSNAGRPELISRKASFDSKTPQTQCSVQSPISGQREVFSTVEEANAYYRNALDRGERTISLNLDLASQNGFDSDDPRAKNGVGKFGFAVDSVEDMKTLFDGIPLDQVNVSMSIHGAVIPLLACFIAAGEEQGLKRTQLNGTLQYEVLKAPSVSSGYFCPPSPSMRSVRDIMVYMGSEMPRFNSISISGGHMRQVGANLVQELAYTLAAGRECLKAAVSKGQDPETTEARLTFTLSRGANAFTRAAKLCAAQLVWHRILNEFNANRSSHRFEGVPSATLGDITPLQIDGLNEDHTNRQLADSHRVEGLATGLANDAWTLIEEIDEMGGMTEAVNSGVVKERIAAFAASYQSSFGRGMDSAVGSNDCPDIESNETDDSVVRDTQIARLSRLRKARDQGECDAALSMVEASSNIDKGNLLALAVDAARARASLGEISMKMEKSIGRITNASTANARGTECKSDEGRDANPGSVTSRAGFGNRCRAKDWRERSRPGRHLQMTDRD